MKNEKNRFTKLKQELSPNGHLIHTSELLARAARLWPSVPALICNNESISFEQLYNRACALAQKLIVANLKPNDCVLLLYENSINFYCAYHAIWLAGGIVAPLNVYLHERELEHIIKDSNARCIIASEPQQKKLAPLSFTAQLLGEDFFTIETNTIFQLPTQPPASPCAVILYTSGTTGLPKGVMLSSEGIITNCLQGIANFKLTGNERVYAALPLFHSYMQNAAVWSPLIVGATVIVIPSISRGALIKGLEYNPTIVLGIPHLYGLFALMKTANFAQVKLFVSGGDSLSNKIRMAFEMIYNRKIANGYGLTETGPFIAVDLRDNRSPTGCVGKPMEGMCVEVRNSENKALPANSEGVLWIKGENCMLGYHNAPEATAKIIHNGWLNTGDVAYLTPDNYIVLCGRERDIISHKGFKIYPPEIENILTNHPDVFMAGVVGIIQDEVEYPVAFVASKNTSPTLIEELKTLCETHLARYKIPVKFYIRKDLPVTATGKVDKKILRKELETLT